MRSKKSLIPLLLPILLLIAAIYLLTYYPADGTARAALESSGPVAVEATPYGWRFDGPSRDRALVFYPGAKVDAAAYAPLMRRLAAAGLDACLVKMPFHLAVFDVNAADRVMRAHPYEHWYVGGHSMGGAIAARYAADHPVDGLILCAAYPIQPLPDGMVEVVIYGSEDGVLNRKNLEKGRRYAPADYAERVIPGGNHARFGSYGPQKGDGAATISAEEQWDETVGIVVEELGIEN